MIELLLALSRKKAKAVIPQSLEGWLPPRGRMPRIKKALKAQGETAKLSYLARI